MSSDLQATPAPGPPHRLRHTECGSVAIHGTKDKSRCNFDSCSGFVYLGWLMGLTAHDTNLLMFKDFLGDAVDFDGKT